MPWRVVSLGLGTSEQHAGDVHMLPMEPLIAPRRPAGGGGSPTPRRN